MKSKKLNLEMYIIAAIIVASIFYLVFRRSDKVHYKVPQLAKIDKETIMKIEIEKNNRIVKLENRKGGWVVGEEAFEPDMTLVEKIKGILSNLKLTTLVSKAGNQFKYELDEKKRINVKVYSPEEKILEFSIGKEAATYDHTHVQIEGDSNIYHCSGSIRRDFDKSIDEFRNKDVFKIDKEEITGILLIMDGKEYAVNKSVVTVIKDDKKSGEDKDAAALPEAEWIYEKNKVDTSRIDSALGMISSLKCDEYMYGENESAGSEQVFTVKLTGSAEHSISIFNSGKTDDLNYRGETSQSKYKFFIKKYKIDNFLDPLKEIFGIKKTDK